MTKFFNTIDDMLAFYYDDSNFAVINAELAKADSPLKTTTGGARNVIFGRKLFSQIVNSMTTFGVLEKKPWEKSGYRALTVAQTTGKGGTSEGGAIRDAILSTYQEITIPPKIAHKSYMISSTQDALKGKDDVIHWADQIEEEQKQFTNQINRALNTDNDTLAGTDIESVDRAIGSFSEINGVSQNAGDLDFHGLDRDAAASFADGFVSHASGVDRTFSLDLLDSVITTIRPFWDAAKGSDNKVITIGTDTLERMQQLLVAQQRFTDKLNAKVGVNGIQTLQGADAGFNVATYQGIPVFPENDMQQDTIGRIYVIDKDSMHFALLRPPQHLETRGQQDYMNINAFATKAVEFVEGELVVTVFQANGKVRDLK